MPTTPPIYATPADMIAEFDERDLVQLTDVDRLAEAEPAMRRELMRAGTVIDGYVATRYSPVEGAAVPPLLHQIALDLAFYGLHRTAAPEKVKSDRDLALSQLRDIASGKLKLDGGDIAAIPARPGAIHQAGQPKRFTRDTLAGY